MFAAKRGVTLIELLVVMAIIAVVMAAGVPAYGRYTRASRFSAGCQDVFGAIKTAQRLAQTKRQLFAVVFPKNAAGDPDGRFFIADRMGKEVGTEYRLGAGVRFDWFKGEPIRGAFSTPTEWSSESLDLGSGFTELVQSAYYFVFDERGSKHRSDSTGQVFIVDCDLELSVDNRVEFESEVVAKGDHGKKILVIAPTGVVTIEDPSSRDF